MNEPEFPLDYIAGLIDAVGRLRFDISQSSARAIGYDARPKLVFRVRSNDYIVAILGTFFDEHGVSYTFRRKDSEARYMLVEDNGSFQIINRLLSGYSIQLARELAFVIESYLPARQSRELVDKEGYLQLIKAIYDLQPGRAENDNTKNTPAFFANEFGLELASISRLEIPNIEYRGEISTEYASGFFDGRGRVIVSLRKNETYDIGYALDPRIDITRPWPKPNLRTMLSNYLVENGIQASIYNDPDMIRISINKIGSVTRFLELVGPELLVLAEQAQYFNHHILTRYRRNDHLTKQGLYEMVKSAEVLFRMTEGQRKYNANYFENMWGDEISPRDLDSILEEPLQNPQQLSEPDTYLPRISVEMTRRASDPEFRQKIISRFDEQCLITGVDDSRLLEAAHIVPWAEDNGIASDPANGLLLNPFHHEAFDRGLFLIDETCHIHVVPTLNIESQFLQENLAELDGTRLKFTTEDRPSPDYIQRRNEQVVWWDA